MPCDRISPHDGITHMIKLCPWREYTNDGITPLTVLGFWYWIDRTTLHTQHYTSTNSNLIHVQYIQVYYDELWNIKISYGLLYGCCQYR